MDYKAFFENPTPGNMNSILENMNASAYFPSKGKWYTKSFTKFLSVFMGLPTKTPIFIYLDVVNYLFDSFAANQKKLGVASEMDAHAIALIMIWNSESKQYEAKVFNPHGEYQCKAEMQYYEIPLSRRRSKKLNFERYGGYNLFIINEFISALNRKNVTPYLILYKQDQYHNYLGVNLQERDDFGICFVFPFLLCEYLIRQSGTCLLTTQTFPNWVIIQSIFGVDSDAMIENQHQIGSWILQTLDILGIGEVF